VQDKNPASDSGRTPLHWAAYWGRFEICRLILQNVEDKNPADNNGDTPLDLAERSHATVAQLIQEYL